MLHMVGGTQLTTSGSSAMSGELASSTTVGDSSWISPASVIFAIFMLLATRVALRFVDQVIDLALARAVAWLLRLLATAFRTTAVGFDQLADALAPRAAPAPVDLAPATPPSPGQSTPEPATPPPVVDTAAMSDAHPRTPTPTPDDVRRPSLPERLVGYGKYRAQTYGHVVRSDPGYCQWTVDHDNATKTADFRLFAAFCRIHGFQRRGGTVHQPQFDLGGSSCGGASW